MLSDDNSDPPDYTADIVNALREPLLVLDFDLRVKAASPAFCRVFRVAPEATVGRLVYELGDGQWDIPALREKLDEIMRSGGTFDDFSVDHHFPGVGPRTMLLNARRLPPIGEIKLILLAIDDITDRRKTERRLSEQARLLDLSNDAIIVRDVHNRINYWNRGAEEIFGYTREEAVGRDLHQLLKTEFEQPFHQMIEELREKGRLIGEVIQYAKDGRRVMLLCRWSLDHDAQGKPASILTTCTDMTERTQIVQAKNRLAAIVESSNDAILSKDLEGIITSWNRGAQQLFGYTAQEAIGRPVTMLFPAHLLDEESGILEHIRRGERMEPYETIRCHKDGTLLDISSTISPIVDSHGRVVGASKILRDISDQKRAEEALRKSEERYHAATAAVSDIMWTNNAEGLLEGEQPGWEAFTGQSREEYQGYGWANAVHPEDAQPTTDAWKQAVAEKYTFVFEHRVRRHDGEWRDCSIRAVPVLNADGAVREWVGVHTDVTQRKRDDENLRLLAAELSEADRRKDEFMATLAHELRNPLAPIRNGLQVIKLAGTKGTVEQALSMMERQLTHMVRLVDDLLDISRVTQGKIELCKERVEVRAIIDAAMETSRPLIEEAGHDLLVAVPDEPIFLHGDPIRLAQVVSNLLSNSAKYMHPGGHIRLTVRRDSEVVAVSVADEGIGIPPAMLDKVFVIFTQLDRTLEKSTGGLGIGLSLVKGLVAMHGGTIEAKSDGHGKGSEFVMRLPVVIEASKAQESGSAAEQPVKSSLRILVVDDNRDGANTLAMLLKILGNDTRTAYDGQAGVDAAREFRPNVILLDIGLPKLNGYEACRCIREQSWGKAILMIAVTGWGQDEDRRRSHEAGFDHHMVKPLDPKALMKMLAENQV